MVEKEGRELKVEIADVVGENRMVAAAAAVAGYWQLVAAVVQMPWQQPLHNHDPADPSNFNKMCP